MENIGGVLIITGVGVTAAALLCMFQGWDSEAFAVTGVVGRKAILPIGLLAVLVGAVLFGIGALLG